MIVHPAYLARRRRLLLEGGAGGPVSCPGGCSGTISIPGTVDVAPGIRTSLPFNISGLTLENGEVLVAFGANDVGDTVTIDAGWTELWNITDTVSSTRAGFAAYRVVDGTEGATETPFTWTTNGDSAGYLMQLRCADPTAVLDLAAYTDDQEDSANLTDLGATGMSAGAMVILSATTANSANLGYTVDNSFTEDNDDGTAQPHLYVAHRNFAAGGNQGTTIVSIVGGSGTADWVYGRVVIKACSA